MLFRHKKPPTEFQVDLGDLPTEKSRLAKFLQQHLTVTVTPHKEKLVVHSESVTLQDLHHFVNKFIYHRDLNVTHWVSSEGSTVKINRFKKDSKKKTKPKKEPPTQTEVQTWGI
ncbi:MAG: hypothetical protein NWE92_13780 [Candidatus Bathyarchaeota archaeon]|nr:hypothetical protein [Candidatus Bathyarchaeota archaeon]